VAESPIILTNRGQSEAHTIRTQIVQTTSGLAQQPMHTMTEKERVWSWTKCWGR